MHLILRSCRHDVFCAAHAPVPLLHAFQRPSFRGARNSPSHFGAGRRPESLSWLLRCLWIPGSHAAHAPRNDGGEDVAEHARRSPLQYLECAKHCMTMWRVNETSRHSVGRWAPSRCITARRAPTGGRRNCWRATRLCDGQMLASRQNDIPGERRTSHGTYRNH